MFYSQSVDINKGQQNVKLGEGLLNFILRALLGVPLAVERQNKTWSSPETVRFFKVIWLSLE